MDGIAYVELYTADGPATVGYFTGHWGFTVIAEAFLADRHATLLQGGQIQLVISRSEGHASPVTDWLIRHRGGVADVAMYCSDVPAMMARAALSGLPVRRRARPGPLGHVSGTVGGLGSVRHTLIEPSRDRPMQPPDFPWVQIGVPRGRGYRWRPQAIDHMALCLPAGQGAMVTHLYQHVFGLQQYAHRMLYTGTGGLEARVLRDPAGTITLVMTEPTIDSRDGDVETFIRAHGDGGVHHLGFRAGAILGSVDAFFHRGVCFTPATSALRQERPGPDARLIQDHAPAAALTAPAAEPASAARNASFEQLCCENLDASPTTGPGPGTAE